MATKKNCNYNFYFIQDGKPVEIKRSTELKIKLSKKEKEKLRQMRKHRNGSISLELYDPYKDFKAKIKEQFMNKEIKANDDGDIIGHDMCEAKAKALAAEMQEKEPDAGWEAMNGDGE